MASSGGGEFRLLLDSTKHKAIQPMLKKEKYRKRWLQKRSGTATVEFAIVAIPLFLFVFGTIEFGRAMMCKQSMEEAARSGSRVSVVQGATAQSVEQEVDTIMQLAGILEYSVEIDPVDFTMIDRWEPITVTVIATFDDMSWLPSPRYLADVQFVSSCSLPKECSRETD